MKEIIILTNDNKLLLSKDNTSKNILVDNSLNVDLKEDKIIIKLINDYDNEGELEVKDNGDIYN